MVDDDDRRRRTPDHGHPISSPCEPNGSGELITSLNMVLLIAWSVSMDPKASFIMLLTFYRENIHEPVCEKTNNLGSDQVRHKPGCAVTEDV